MMAAGGVAVKSQAPFLKEECMQIGYLTIEQDMLSKNLHTKRHFWLAAVEGAKTKKTLLIHKKKMCFFSLFHSIP